MLLRRRGNPEIKVEIFLVWIKEVSTWAKTCLFCFSPPARWWQFLRQASEAEANRRFMNVPLSILLVSKLLSWMYSEYPHFAFYQWLFFYLLNHPKCNWLNYEGLTVRAAACYWCNAGCLTQSVSDPHTYLQLLKRQRSVLRPLGVWQ